MADEPERVRFCTACGKALQWQALRCKTCGAKLRPTGARAPSKFPAPIRREREADGSGGDYRLRGDPKEVVRMDAPWPYPQMTYAAADVGVVDTEDEQSQRALEEFMRGTERRVTLVRLPSSGTALQVQALWCDAEGRQCQAIVGRLPDDVAKLLDDTPLGDWGARPRLLLVPTEQHSGSLRIDIGRLGLAGASPGVVADPTPLERTPRSRGRWWNR